jgi:hypothetical protein
MLGKVLTGKDITAYGDGHDRLIGGKPPAARCCR